jgi:hypothetical protein
MHRCPECGYEFGPLPGVPSGRFGRFGPGVDCPECGCAIPEGALLVVGSSLPAGAQPITRRRRLIQFALAVAPQLYLLQFGIQGAVEVVRAGVGGLSALSMLKASCLLVPVALGHLAWRRWNPRKGEGGRAPIASDVQWSCEAGRLRVFGSPGSRSTPKEYPAEDIRSIVATSPVARGKRWDAGDRLVATITANVWQRDRRGRRSTLASAVINVDAGDVDVAPGIDRAAAAVVAGDRIANLIRRAIGLRPMGDEAHATDAADAGGETPASTTAPTCSTEGELHPNRLNGVRLLTVMTMVILLILGVMPLVITASIAISRWVSSGPQPQFPAWAGWHASVAVPLLVAGGAFVWAMDARERRRALSRARWDAGPHGLRVTETHFTRRGEEAARIVRDIPADRIAAIAPETVGKQIRLEVRDAAGREIASLTPEAMPDGGAAEIADRLTRALRPPPSR